MSQFLKRALVAGNRCIEQSGERPGAIVVGTGRACTRDLNVFLRSAVGHDTDGVSPISFINSSHNNVAAQLALIHGVTGYNTTYCHRGFSLESALTDAMMLLSEGKARSVLTGAMDEYTENSFLWDSASGLWKQEGISSLDLLQSQTPGTICGEGTAFFMWEATPSPRAQAVLRHVATRLGQREAQGILLQQARERSGLDLATIDLVLVGANGDSRTDASYQDMIRNLEPGTPHVAGFKHLCGEYMTATGFALWLAGHILEQQVVPEICKLQQGTSREINNVMIYNQFGTQEHSLIYLTRS
jgi:3-oxoacyl-(acyl-carrier-protein) synthase